MTDSEKLACLTGRPCNVCNFRTENGCTKWACVFEEESEADSEDDTTSWKYDETHAWYECKKCGMSELWEAKFCPNCGRRAVSK